MERISFSIGFSPFQGIQSGACRNTFFRTSGFRGNMQAVIHTIHRLFHRLTEFQALILRKNAVYSQYLQTFRHFLKKTAGIIHMNFPQTVLYTLPQIKCRSSSMLLHLSV
jgi:hypothetical protein